MDSGAAITLFTVLSLVICLTVNILFYRLVFKKQTRVKANTFSWLTTLGIMLVVNIVLVSIILNAGIQTGDGWEGVGGALGVGLFLPFVLAPLLWFFPASGFSLIRIIFIAITRNRKREILQDDIQETDLNIDPAYAAKEPEQ